MAFLLSVLTQPPTQVFLGELVFHLSPPTPAQPKTTFLSQAQPITLYFPNPGKLTLTARSSDNYSICIKHWEIFLTSNKCQIQSGKNKIQSKFRILRALHNLSEGKKRRKTVTLGSRSVVFSLSTLYCTIVDWSLTMQIKNEKGMLFSVEQAFVGRDEK